MDVEVVAIDRLPEHAARRIATHLRNAITARGTATLAVSGGTTPVQMLAALAGLPIAWERVHVLQVDERIAPDDDPARNLAGLESHLAARLAGRLGGLHPMPVTAALGDAQQAAAAATRYDDLLSRLAGDPPRLDVVHLGLGDDGHTASLVPGDDALKVEDRGVAVSGSYRGHRRLTLTLPTIARARRRVWLVAGADKAEAVRRLVAGDPTIPAGRVPRRDSVLVVDPAGGSQLPHDVITSTTLGAIEPGGVMSPGEPGGAGNSAPPA